MIGLSLEREIDCLKKAFKKASLNSIPARGPISFRSARRTEGSQDQAKTLIGGSSGGPEQREIWLIGLGILQLKQSDLRAAYRCERASNRRIRLITAATLRSHTSKDLAQMAKTNGVPGWHSMRKEQLVKALLKQAKSKSRSGKLPRGSSKSLGKPKLSKSPVARKISSNGASTRRSNPTKAAASESRIARQIRQERQQQESLKNLALINSLERGGTEPEQDRVIAVVRDPYWIQAYWEVSKSTVARAKVALSDHWHTAQPVIRLLNVVSDSSTTSTETIVREIKVHGGVRNWFVDVPEPPKSYRIAIGYTTECGKFHLVAKSNCVTTPAPNTDSFDHNWIDIADDFKKFYALSGGYSQTTTNELQEVFEDKLHRPMNQPEFVRLGNGINNQFQSFDFEVDAHMIIQGVADPNANVTLAGEPIKLENDGTFSVKMNLPDRRQVLPIVAASRDGTQQRTTVLAIERNTKIMEPVTKELDEL